LNFDETKLLWCKSRLPHDLFVFAQTLPSFRITSIQVQAVDGMQTLSLASVESYFQQASIPASLFVKPTAAE